MCTARIVAAVNVAVLCGAMASRAVAFQNLDFEASPVASNAPFTEMVPTSLLFPAWTVRFANTVQSTGSVNGTALAGNSATLFAYSEPGVTVLEGTKSLYLAAWFNSSASIAQEGEVPIGTESVRFRARNHGFAAHPDIPGPFRLRMDLQTLPLAILSQADGDFVYGADISAWAGSNAELRIEISGYGIPGYTGWSLIDGIEFSPDPIPEPAATAIVAAFAGWLLGCRRTRQR